MFRKIAKRVGCFTSIDNQQIFDCMREISAEKLLSMQEYIFKNEEESFADFAIDGEVSPLPFLNAKAENTDASRQSTSAS